MTRRNLTREHRRRHVLEPHLKGKDALSLVDQKRLLATHPQNTKSEFELDAKIGDLQEAEICVGLG